MADFRAHQQAFLCALQFLTQLPVRLAGVPDGRVQGLAMLYYPLVGLLIGGLLWCCAALTLWLPPAVQATLVLLVWCVLSGGLHLDGLADSADGWMGGLGDRERTLRIMKDPHIGATGVIALLLQLLLKWSLLSALLPAGNGWVLLLAPLAGRTQALLLLATTPYASPGGIASAMLAGLDRRAVRWLALGVALLLLATDWRWLALPALLFWLGRRAMLKRLGGATGDTAGALIELTETALLLAALLSGAGGVQG